MILTLLPICGIKKGFISTYAMGTEDGMIRSIQGLHKISMSYEDIASLFVDLYRFFTYVLAVLLIQVIPLDTPREPAFHTYVILGLVGIYTLVKVFSSLVWKHKFRLTPLVLGIDVVACTMPMMFTGGLDSGFLLYALTPVIGASLFFSKRIAYITASVLVFQVFLAHLGLSQWTDEFAWIMHSNYLPLCIIYCIFCYLIVALTYRINMSVRERIETRAMIDEGTRIKQELHDGVAQELGYLRMKAQSVGDLVSRGDTIEALRGLGEINKVLKDAYADVRWYIDSLGETKIIPVVSTFGDFAREFGEKNGIETEIEMPLHRVELSPVAELQLLRIFREALNNVRKYAQASKVMMKLNNVSGELKMIIKDNGCGFNPQKNSHHHGLVIMRERAECLGGTCDVASSPGEGTEISISIPIEKVRS